MDAMGLPMAFGKKSKNKAVNVQAKVDQTKRDDDFAAPPPRPSEDVKPPVRSGPMGPPALPHAVPQTATDDGEDDEDVGPKPPSPGVGSKRKAEGEADTEEDGGRENVGNGGDGDEDEDEGFEEGDDAEGLPISHEIVLKDHTKVCSAIAVDPSGARVATGSHDYDTKLWDFGGMDSRLKPFKSFEANGNYYVRDLDYSPDGQNLLIISGSLQAKVFSREGDTESAKEFVRGDVYLRDMKVTKGHTAEINGGHWHPTDKNLFLTCSNDSTLRIWDLNDRWKQKHVIVVRSKERGARTRVTACAWSPDGKLIAGACMDGTLHVWKVDSNYARPYYSCETAHTKDTETTSIVFSRDSSRIATRGGDNTIKLFNVKSMRKPLAVALDLENRYPDTDLTYSPDGRSILTGLPPASAGEKGSIVFLDAEDLKEQRRTPVGEGTVVRVLWHSRINQIFATMSTGAVHILYSPRLSIHGALLPLSKIKRTAPRDISFTSSDLKPVIFTPDALPMFADEKYGESLHQKEKRGKKMKPMEPMTGAGKGGRLGASATASMVQGVFKDRLSKEDPREALLKYAEKKDEE